jgi:trehalose-phosphatase
MKITSTFLMTSELPSALDKISEVLAGCRPRVIFLDYDGTLTPIVGRPEAAVLNPATREIVRRLARQVTVAVISGRDLTDVRERVALEELIYAGSHGFDIAGPGGLRKEHEEARDCLPALDAVEKGLRENLASVPGALVERKKYSVAVHYRNVAEEREAEVLRVVERLAKDQPKLRRSGGKKVYELQPGVDWHKGRAVLWLLERLGLNGRDVAPVYVGDDLTDEDAFESLRGRGVGIVVRDEARSTAAAYALENPEEVGEFLVRISHWVERDGAK